MTTTRPIEQQDLIFAGVIPLIESYGFEPNLAGLIAANTTAITALQGETDTLTTGLAGAVAQEAADVQNLQGQINAIVIPGVTLGTLGLFPLTATQGTPYVGVIVGKTTGSTVTLTSSDGTVLTVDASGNVTGTFATSGNPTITPTEVLSGAANSPNVSDGLAMTVAANVTLGTLTLSQTTFTASSTFTVNIVGLTSGSTVTATSSDGTALTVSGTTVSGRFMTAGTPVVTLTETLSGASNSPNASNVPVTVNAASALGPTTASFTLGTAAGTIIAAITGLLSGETAVSISPSDSKVLIGTAHTNYVVGTTASTAGTITYTVRTSNGRTLATAITVTTSAGNAVTFGGDPLVFNTDPVIFP